MALRTISRDDGGSVVKIWPAGVKVADVKVSQTHAASKLHYANDADGNAITPAMIAADVFKNAFGFVPCTGSVGSYVMRKARANTTSAQKLEAAIKGLVKDALADED